MNNCIDNKICVQESENTRSELMICFKVGQWHELLFWLAVRLDYDYRVWCNADIKERKRECSDSHGTLGMQ